MYKHTGASESQFHPLTSMSFLLYKSSIICMGVPYLCHEGHQSRIGVVSLLDFMRSSSRASQVYVKPTAAFDTEYSDLWSRWGWRR
jgi:hypothetical protein